MDETRKALIAALGGDAMAGAHLAALLKRRLKFMSLTKDQRDATVDEEGAFRARHGISADVFTDLRTLILDLEDEGGIDEFFGWLKAGAPDLSEPEPSEPAPIEEPGHDHDPVARFPHQAAPTDAAAIAS